MPKLLGAAQKLGLSPLHTLYGRGVLRPGLCTHPFHMQRAKIERGAPLTGLNWRRESL